MSPKFGTSGLRGLVTDLTDDLVGVHVRAFLAACDTGDTLYVGRDLRASSPGIQQAVTAAAQTAGYHVVDCGALATPALALAAGGAGCGAVMVTGSHIPADRNGLKFYSRSGEITKVDEAAIQARLTDLPCPAAQPGALTSDPQASDRFVQRYLAAYGPQALPGRRIGLYAHSAVGRDMLAQVLRGLGAEVIELGRSEDFIPVDTEAVDAETRAVIKAWVTEHDLEALVSMDGDSDRPLCADETGRIVPGDILGQITAQALQAQTVVTPISSNSGVTQKGFGAVKLTRIGSPYVIAGMQETTGRVVGYEANGGFLLGFGAAGLTGPLPPLVTRDCVLPLAATLVAALGPGTESTGTVSARVAQEPAVVTVADRLQDVPIAASQQLMADLRADKDTRADLLRGLGADEMALDLTDGVRMTLTGGATLHIRPSGNAPEVRVYVEGPAQASAETLLAAALALLETRLRDHPAD